MNAQTVRAELLKENKTQNYTQRVNNYSVYLNSLLTEVDKKTGQQKNPWAAKMDDKHFVFIYKKVAQTGVTIDGEMVTIQYLGGKLTANFNYQAYKNLVIARYPETIFDVQVAYEGDTYTFKKESGKVIYEHILGDPFRKEVKPIGAYCVVKNSRGEFLETLNMAEIQKMRNVAKTQSIWNEWESEMIKKSVMKRACKTHFKDIVGSIDEIDNENNDLEKAGLPAEMQSKIEKCTTIEELQELYELNKADVTDEPAFLRALKERETALSIGV